MENATTRSKMEALKEHLAAKRERRKARRHGDPYSLPCGGKERRQSGNDFSNFKWSLDSNSNSSTEPSTPTTPIVDTPLQSPSTPTMLPGSGSAPSFPAGSAPATPTDMVSVEGQSLSTWTAESEAAEVAASSAGDDSDQQSGAPVIA